MAGVSDPPSFHRAPSSIVLRSYFLVFGRLLTFLCDPAGLRNGARRRWMLQELTFVDSVLLLTVFDLAAVRGKFSCKNTPKFTARPELGRT